MKKNFKIGMRIIKTAIAVLLSISVFLLLLWIDNLVHIDHSEWRAPSNMYTPFFAGIAAIYATHRDPKTSFKQARIRSFGSVLGGYYGMIVLMLGEWLFLDVLNLQNIIAYKAIYFFLVAIAVIPLFQITVLMKHTTATFITGLTYLSVTISIRNGGMPAFQFATNRILSTLVGVGISLLVNNFSLFFKRNKNVLFVSSLDNNLLNNEAKISPYIKYKLNNLYYDEMNLCFATTRTLSSLEYIFDEVNVNKPMVIMNGSAIYNFDKTEYYHINYIDKDIRVYLDNMINECNLNAFSYTINNNIMHCYHNKLKNPGELDYYNKRKNGNFYAFVRGILPEDLDVNLYVLIDTKENIQNLVNKVIHSEYNDAIDLVVYDYDIEGYSYLKINSRVARKEIAMKEIMQDLNTKYMIVCGSGNTDLPLMEKADLSVCLKTAPKYVCDRADYIIDSDNPESILRLYSRLYHAKNIEKEITKLKRSFK